MVSLVAGGDAGGAGSEEWVEAEVNSQRAVKAGSSEVGERSGVAAAGGGARRSLWPSKWRMKRSAAAGSIRKVQRSTAEWSSNSLGTGTPTEGVERGGMMTLVSPTRGGRSMVGGVSGVTTEGGT